MPPAARWLVAGLLAWCPGVVPAVAQSEAGAQQERPADGLFQRGATRAGSRTERLVLTLSALTSHDGRGAESLLGGERALSGASGEFTGQLAYSKPFRKVLFGLTASGGGRHHQDMTELLATTYTAGASLMATVSRRGTLGARASYVAAPYYAFTLFPAAEPVDAAAVDTPSRDHAVTTRRYQAYEGGSTFSRSVGRYGRVNLRAEARRSSVEEDPARLLDVQAGGDISREFGRFLTAHVGYNIRYGETRAPLDRHFVRVHDGDVGLTYAWQRTQTRRTVFSLSAGPSVVVEGERERVGWQGQARVSHMIGRSWALNGRYRRGVRFVLGFDEPFFSDAGTLTLDGLIGSRWRVTASGGLAVGDVGLDSLVGQDVSTRSASGTLQYAVSRRMAVFGSYVYYAYRFGSGVSLPAGEQPDLSRSGIRFGMTLWVPLFSGADHGAR